MNDEELRDAYAARLARDPVDPARTGCVSPEDMLAVVEGRASEEQREDVVDHAMSCRLCRREFESLRALARAGERLAADDAGTQPAAAAHNERGTSPAPARPRRQLPWPPLAAAATVVVLLGANLVWQRVSRPAPADPEPMRSAPGVVVASAVAAVAPVGAVPQPPVALTWRAVAGAERYRAELLDSAGTALHAADTRDTVLLLPARLRLTPGAEYQWWVRAELRDGERRSEMQTFRVERP